MVERRTSILSFRPRTSPEGSSTSSSSNTAQISTPSSRAVVETPTNNTVDGDSTWDGLGSAQGAVADRGKDSGKKKKSLSDVGHRVGTMVRRASTSMSRLSGRPTKSSKSSNNGEGSVAPAPTTSSPSVSSRSCAAAAALPASASLSVNEMIMNVNEVAAATPPARPPTGAHTLRPRRSIVDQVQTGFRTIRRRRQAVSAPSGQDARHIDLKYVAPPEQQRFYVPPLERAGDAARAAARASAAEYNNERIKITRLLTRKSSRTQGVDKDSDSARFVDCMDPVHVPLVRKDPMIALPTEISALILSYLDYQSLLSAEQASKAWNEAATSQHVWREVFLRAFEPKIHVSPTPIQMGGYGVGGAIQPGRDWRSMYRARVQIEANWQRGTHGCAAIYMSGHTDSVYCCQFDETKIITGSRDRTIRVWDINTYRCLKVIGGPASLPVAPAPDMPPLETHPVATVSALPSLNGTPQGDALYHVPSDYHSASILCLMFDAEIMVTGSSDSTCIMWDVRTFEPLRRLRKHTAGVLDVCFDAAHIVSCSKDATICVWDRATGNLLKTLTGHRGPVNAVQLRGNLLVSASGDGMAKLWDVTSGAVVKEFQSRDRGLAAVEFSDDAKFVLAGGNDQVIYKFDANTAELVHTYSGHTALVRSLFLDTMNNRVLSGSYDQGMRLYEFNSGRQLGVFADWTTSWILAAKCDYRRVVATSQDGRALMLDFGLGVEGAGKGVDLLRAD